ncbi:putative NBD/HSP70 family sugar kinase [Evansella vedderi]|uniref:NBD/HSP70 family sugar kinase n=1 Tax=Evansella vedderi TaxID=38282 RepID=A0ABU0A3B2_9BACI|nr:ROK family transcriptional regulator [Evansella vedderi]MDQ0257976.1 putative NBD/HSP70 family sugar kinase [Evansella vedderi]
MEKHDNVFIKKQNKKWVLDIIKNNRPISRAEVSKITDMSPTSISRIVQELEQDGFIKESDLISNGVGRKATLLDVRPDANFSIGVELTEKHFKIGILNFLDEMTFSQTFPVEDVEDYMKTLNDGSRLIKRIINEQEIPMEKIVGIAIGVPGFIDYENGVVAHSTQLKWNNVPIVEIIESATSLKAIVDNDLKMKAMAEYTAGAAKSSKSSVLIGIGSGIGSAIIMNGEFYRGENNIAGEISHTVVDINGNLCRCGKFGCLATVLTESSILQQARKIKEVSSLKQLLDYYNSGETWAINIIDRVTTYIVTTITNILYIYNPEVLVLSGFILEDFPEIQALIKKKYKLYLTEPFKTHSRIVFAELKDHGIVKGAGIQAQKVLFRLQ